MEKMNVGVRIRYFRRLRGFSQEQLALEAGINPAFLGHLERGLKSPTITTLDKLVRALGITFEDLFSEETSPPEDYELEIARKRLELLMRGLSSEQLNILANIIQDILRFQEAPPAARVPPVSDDNSPTNLGSSLVHG